MWGPSVKMGLCVIGGGPSSKTLVRNEVVLYSCSLIQVLLSELRLNTAEWNQSAEQLTAAERERERERTQI